MYNSVCKIKNTDDEGDEGDEALLVVFLCQLTNPAEDVVELCDGLQGSFVSLLQVTDCFISIFISIILK